MEIREQMREVERVMERVEPLFDIKEWTYNIVNDTK